MNDVYKVEPNRCYVYKVTNKKTGKYYIGSKTTLNADNYYIGYNYFTSSTDTEFVEDFKNNTKAWKHEVLKYFDDKQECLDYEATLIEEAWENDRADLINKGFVRKNKKTNHIVSSNCNSPESVRKRSETYSKRWSEKTDEERKIIVLKRCANRKYSPRNDEYRKKISVSLKEYYEEYGSPRKGASIPVEVKRKISETLKGRKHSEEEKKKCSDSVKKAKSEVSKAFKLREDKSVTWNQFQKEWKEEKV